MVGHEEYMIEAVNCQGIISLSLMIISYEQHMIGGLYRRKGIYFVCSK